MGFTGYLRRGFAFAVLAGGMLTLTPLGTSVEAASPTTATLTIQKGGDRTGRQTVGGLAGATFDFYAGVAGTRPTPGTTPVAASCTTTAPLGRCSVDVPGRTGFNQGYWIVERTAPAGFTAPQSLDTGFGPTTPTVYNGVFTGRVDNNQTYTFPVATTGNRNPEARGSTWADIRDNPALPNKCGLTIALLIDVSGSIRPDLPSVKTAANGFVDALTGTPSRIALYTFATGANAVLGPTPVSDTSGADTVKTAINGLTAGGGTNWDSGIFQIAAAPTTYDAVVMLTDGNPTYYGPNPDGPGDFTRFREVENGIFSANAVKALGTKMVAVGVGAGVSDSDLNLQAISGPVRGVDFVQTDYAALAAVFREIALRTCAGTISVVKKVIPPRGRPVDGVPTGGWTFSTPTANVTPPSAVTAADSGAVSFSADLNGAPSLPVTINETLQSGYTLVQVGGNNATCSSDGNPVTATNSGATGFMVSALRNAIVTCTVYNEAPTPPASVLVNKTWTINGTTYPEPSQPAPFQATLQLTGQVTPLWGQTYGGYQEGNSVTVGETIDQNLLPPGCTVTPSGDLGSHTLAAGLNTYAVLNTVTCTTKLKLLKTVFNEYGPPAPENLWTLSAFAPGAGTPLISGPSGVNGDVQPAVRYSLAETSVPGYTQEVVTGSLYAAPATGSWRCKLRMRDGTLGPEFDGLNGAVTIQLGQHAECTAKNIAQPARLTLKKVVANTHGGTAVPTDWILNATPGSPDHDAVLISGRDGQPSVTGAEAIPNTAYALSETGPALYAEVGDPECVLTGTTTAVPLTDRALTPEIGQDITCTFRNEDLPRPPTPTPTPSPGPIIPVTGGDLTAMAAGGLLAVLIGAGMLLVARRRRS